MASVTQLPGGDLVVMGGRGRDARGLDRVFKLPLAVQAQDTSTQSNASTSTGGTVPVTQVPGSDAGNVTAVTLSPWQRVQDFSLVHPIWTLVLLVAALWAWNRYF